MFIIQGLPCIFKEFWSKINNSFGFYYDRVFGLPSCLLYINDSLIAWILSEHQQ